MRLIIDTESKELTIESENTSETINLYSKRAFEEISKQWVKTGWNEKYSYTFSWMGRPIIQLPEDMIRIQEVIYNMRPDVIIETGVAHGGSLIYYASLCKTLGKGRVVGVDLEIRPHNRLAIEQHELYPFITLVEGDSVAAGTVKKVKDMIRPDETTMVILDSCHTKEHVLNELNAYKDVVTKGSYIFATDGIMKDLYDVPRGKSDWIRNNPADAALKFIDNNPDFILEKPQWIFNESELTENVTHWPGSWIKRK